MEQSKEKEEKEGWRLHTTILFQKFSQSAVLRSLLQLHRLRFDDDGSRASLQHQMLMIIKTIQQPPPLLLIISQKRSMLLSMAVKIQQLLIIMHYLPNISNNFGQRGRACMCTAVLIVDSITAAMFYSWCICYHCLIISKKRGNACDNSKGGG